MRVVLTGATGYLAGRMLPALQERYDLVLIDARSTHRKSNQPVEGVQIADLTNPDRDTYRAHFRQADAVVHCAYGRANRKDPDVHFAAELQNIQMAYNLYRICQEEAVRRMVVFSSNHAADFTEGLFWQGVIKSILPDMRPLPNNIYGWAKSAYELLGFTFACDKIGHRPVENIQLRIGSPWDWEFRPPKNAQALRRYLGAYLSVRDQAQLVIKSIENENIADQNGIPFQIFYGISGNSDRFWSIDNAQKVVGYAPEDDCAIKFSAQIAQWRQQWAVRAVS